MPSSVPARGPIRLWHMGVGASRRRNANLKDGLVPGAQVFCLLRASDPTHPPPPARKRVGGSCGAVEYSARTPAVVDLGHLLALQGCETFWCS